MGDLIVTDEEYEAYIEAIKAFGNAVEDRIIEYLRIMRAVRTTAILHGRVGLRLDEYINATESLLRESTRIQSIATSLCLTDYVSGIDEADEFVY
ncbi:MAG: hypothetical protein FWH40_09560 [Coriobacteriia bacterium]|nr:hypothetical protein [Coriobacteriia bacterium]